MIPPHSAASARSAKLHASMTISRATRTSDPQRDAVAAGIGAARERAVAQHDAVRVADLREEVGGRLDLVALALETGEDAPRHATLEMDGVGRIVGEKGADEEAWPLDRLLHVHAVVEDVRQHL